MITVADANIPALQETFGRHAQIRALEGRTLVREQLRDAQALIVRSVTRVDERLLSHTPVEFVGSTTIGTDHLDLDWLDAQGIAWASAPGSNADAAAQYTLAMMLLAWERLGRDPADESVGIIGRGNVGGRLAVLLRALGIANVACDPPLEDQGVAGLVDLEQALAQSTVSLHVPLTRSGKYPTRRLIGPEELAAWPRGALLVNAARGEVLQPSAVARWLTAGQGQVALDTWPDEPRIDDDLLRAATVATPHVAGHTEDGKRRGTAMIHAAFCRHFHLEYEPLSPLPASKLTPGWEAMAPERWTSQAIMTATGISRDDAALKGLAGRDAKARGQAFDDLRRDYPSRREFRFLQLTDAPIAARTRLQALGFDLRTIA